MVGENESHLILNTPLSPDWPEDRLYWWLNSNGMYSVHFGYWLAKVGHVRDWFNDVHERERACWNLVWGLSGPPKLNHFVWRACKGALVVKESCKTSSNELIVFLSLAWAVCSYRNKIINEKDQPNMDCMACGFVALVEDYHLHHYKPKLWVAAACGVWSSSRWTCLPVGHVKINVDAQLRDDGIIGFGAVIRDHRGKIQVTVVHRIEASWKATMEEAHAALFDVQLASRLGYTEVILESDSLQVVQAIITEADGGASIFLFYDDIVKRKNAFNSFLCSHVKRDGNRVSHLVARGDVEVGLERIWFDPIPQNFCMLADFDLI
ncbi:Transcription-repair-coupling factor [Bienertia sinuspersici]